VECEGKRGPTYKSTEEKYPIAGQQDKTCYTYKKGGIRFWDDCGRGDVECKFNLSLGGGQERREAGIGEWRQGFCDLITEWKERQSKGKEKVLSKRGGGVGGKGGGGGKVISTDSKRNAWVMSERLSK